MASLDHMTSEAYWGHMDVKVVWCLLVLVHAELQKQKPVDSEANGTELTTVQHVST